MYYYEVLVSSTRYHGSSALTYESPDKLLLGSVIQVPMQRQSVLGVISKQVTKPNFQTKAIAKTIVSQAVPPELLELIAWLADYYPAPLGQILGLLLPAGLQQSSRLKPAVQAKQPTQKLPVLTTEQQQAVKRIQELKGGTVLLHGDTGTGKTRVYLEITQTMLAKGRSAIILTPEIGLTPQLVGVFKQTFPNKVIVMHSNLTPAERRDSWLAIASAGEPVIVIGPRSALFSPVPSLGLIVLDEVHDSAYKQEQAPYYQASRVAAKLGDLHGALTIFGTATPPVSDYYTFRSKRLPIIRLREPALKSQDIAPETMLINLRDREKFNRSPWLADPLITAIAHALEKGEQSLLFLNRRGTARLVLCQVCGWQAVCPRCDLPLTYHGDTHLMQCHTCGYSEPAVAGCPECGATDIVFQSIGTKSLVSELTKLFPKARIARFDSDTKKTERLEAQYESIRNGGIDILVGTQMLGKGLDLPKLSVLGVVVADTSLYFPDYTAEERTFQMLTQVMGRVNRGHTAGMVIIQSYHPDNPVIHTAINKDYEGFYERQIAERQQFGFPPFTYVLKVHTAKASRATAQKAAQNLANELRVKPGLQIIGPTPAFIEKKNGRYHWQLIVMAKHRPLLTGLIADLPSGWKYDIDPSHLL